MKKPIFITGNKNKAKDLERYLEFELETKKIEIDEIQSLDLERIVEAKARSAYGLVGSPVLVEDTSLKYSAFGNLPGPFIRWFHQELGNSGLCRIINHYNKDRSANVEICFGYFDGKNYESFNACVDGKISAFARGENGFGWDPIFIPNGSDKTYGEMLPEEKETFSARKLAAEKLKKFLKEE